MQKIYDNIQDLPLKNFRECLISNNLKHLVISGRPSKKKLEQAWQNIWNEYFDLMAAPISKRHIRVQAEISVISSRLKCIKVLTDLLIEQWENDIPERKKIIDLLNSILNVKFKFNSLDDVKRIIKRSKGLDLKLKILQDDLRDIEKNLKKEGEQPTLKYFTNVLITLGDFSKYRITDEISTFEFCERLRRYNKFVRNHGK